MKKTLLALALIGASSTAMADALIYAGASVGQSDYNSSTGTAMGFHVGTGLLPIIGVEAGYWQLGDLDVNSGAADFSTWYAAVKPSIDLGPVHLYGRAGLHSYNVDYTKGYTGSTSGTSIMYGVGAEYFVFSMLSIGAGYQNFADVKTRSGKHNVDSFTVNATFHFL
ncbi:hypothetical protein BCU68_00435 [Vibrio sp. 10N.286.49.B3]|uniref:outer membrane beta-barrel protein n=1 Tax=Vibrio sp. 10N.286.49.B3 TaxID=1880855 RepID=UPI000C835736|nr:outer membrane beta-barrel protein [Vibrio sp. 10N.286.49.B3]PMH46552.1 hypothetical protein BCU68_00435 [Vibrio sp. 10N.286.49.B3]